jgi:hypothetical protein
MSSLSIFITIIKTDDPDWYHPAPEKNSEYSLFAKLIAPKVLCLYLSYFTKEIKQKKY